MGELSIFIDESGVQEDKTPYYLVTLVLHDQQYDIRGAIAPYEERLGDVKPPNMPFHSRSIIIYEENGEEHNAVPPRLYALPMKAMFGLKTQSRF